MERTSDLLGTIATQKEQLKRYESRLRDVVRAYKGIVKEKEALEASLKVLSAYPAHGQGADRGDEGQGRETDGQNTEPAWEKGGETLALKEQLQTLSTSLSTLTQEKSRLEASYVADKKQMRLENENLEKRLHQEVEKRQKENADLQFEITQLHDKIRSHQLEREKEQTDHGVMLKELQLLVSEERTAKELLETQLESAQGAIQDGQTTQRDTQRDSQLYEKRIADLSLELTTLRKRLREADNKSNIPSPLLLDLKKEMEEMKKNYQQQLSDESRRANDAEGRMRSCSKQAEDRISSLEAKLSEISEIIGNYDKLRVKDQDVINRLKERVSQLDTENSALAFAASGASMATMQCAEAQLDVDAIVERIRYLKEALAVANEKSGTRIDIIGLLSGDGVKTDGCLQCGQYKDDLEHVKEEFERYKLRAQSVLKNKTKPQESSSKEVDVLKEQNSQLREKVKQLHHSHDQDLDAQHTKVDQLSRTLQLEQDSHRHALATLRSDHTKQIQEMEDELKKQRGRTVAMLAEKDGEISTLKGSSIHTLELEYMGDGGRGTSSGGEGGRGEEDESAVNRLLSQSQGHSETLLLHFAQEQARRDVELSSLRKQKRQLESALREVQLSSSLRQEKVAEENARLQEDLWKQQRNVTRESANLEYLKNVVYSFLTSSDRQGKKQMLKAIMTILEFSPKERDSVYV